MTDDPVLPSRPVNRAGLDAIDYRVGVHASFLAAMQRRLAKRPGTTALRTRELDDPAIALLDAWAVVADVLTFYQERIANEGYVGTATELKSLVEIGRLVGYAPRPGIAAGTHLAYTLEPDSAVEIPAGSAAQSVPEPGALPQTFETLEALPARAAWNRLLPRRTKPTVIGNPETIATVWLSGASQSLKPNDLLLFSTDGRAPVLRRIESLSPDSAADRTRVDLQGAVEDAPPPAGEMPRLATFEVARRLVDRLVNPPASLPERPQRSRAVLADSLAPGSATSYALLKALHPAAAPNLEAALSRSRIGPPPSVRVFGFRVKAAPFGHNAPKRPVLSHSGQITGYREWTLTDRGGLPTEDLLIRVAGLGGPGLVAGGRRGVSVTVKLAGHAPTRPQPVAAGSETRIDYEAAGETITVIVEADAPRMHFRFRARAIDIDLSVAEDTARATGTGVALTELSARLARQREAVQAVVTGTIATGRARFAERATVVSLDATYDTIIPGGLVVIERPDRTIISRVGGVASRTRADYGMTGKVTELTTADPWIARDDAFEIVRGTTVHASSQELALAPEPVTDAVAGARIELDALYPELQPGRWVIVEGERADVAGVRDAELVMLGKIDIDRSLPGDAVHTYITVTPPLAFGYRRDTTVIHGNVAVASQGETVGQVLGSGDASTTYQSFELRQQPVTRLPAATPSGTRNALAVRVNGVLWHEAESFVGAGPLDRIYVLHTDDAGKTTVTFGNGITGARLPTGQENVSAVYRVGIGSQGNVAAGRLNQLASRPLHVTAVVNPQRATGGGDPPGPDAVRDVLPLGLTALGRLESATDYGDFALGRPGIGKALAVALPRRFRSLIHVSIAGTDEIPLDDGSRVGEALLGALRGFGDPNQAIVVTACRFKLLVLQASVRLLDDFAWESVQPRIRAALLAALGFAQRAIGQPVWRSEVIAAIQQVEGVAWLTLDRLATVRADVDTAALIAIVDPEQPVSDVAASLPRIDPETGAIRPAELVFMSGTVPQLVALMEIGP